MKKSNNKPSPTYFQNLSLYFSQYCSVTSIHGVRYLGERGRFAVEKIVWILLLIVVCYFCIFLIMKSYYKWLTSPVIFSFGTEETPIHNIPFPAVTICPEAKSDPDVFNYTDVALRLTKNKTITSDEQYYYANMTLTCNSGFGSEFFQNYSKFTNINPFPTLVKIFPGQQNNFKILPSWIGDYAFNSISLTYTENGLCYSFNMLSYREILNEPDEIHVNLSSQNSQIRNWTLDDGYSSAHLADAYPRRTHLAGIDGGFKILLFTNDSHVDNLCSVNPEGFKVTLHFPSDWPSMDKHFHISLDKTLLIAIKPKLITISEPLKAYKPKNRKCYLSIERRLKCFKFYSQSNCMTECLTNYIIFSCGCSPFYVPHNYDDTICNLGSLECIEESTVKFYSSYKDINNVDYEYLNCNCLSSCISLEYDMEITQSTWNWRKRIQILKNNNIPNYLDHLESHHITSLIMYYKEMQFLNTQRNELYGYVEFFASIGGLMGLFIGISATSGLEILYFLTLRLACNIKMYGTRFWPGDQYLSTRSNNAMDT